MATDTKMLTARKTPRYRGGVDFVVARRMNPTAATHAAPAQNGPRMRNLSDRKATRIMVKKVRRYGGALRPLDWTLVKDPISAMIVGTNNGREAKQTLQEKYMRLGM